jgi:hypothetical protein
MSRCSSDHGAEDGLRSINYRGAPANRKNNTYLAPLSSTILCDERLSPNLPRGRCKSIGGDFDIDDEGFEQNFEPLQSLHHRSVGYQSV